MAEVLLTSEGIIRLNDRFLGPTLRKLFLRVLES